MQNTEETSKGSKLYSVAVVLLLIGTSGYLGQIILEQVESAKKYLVQRAIDTTLLRSKLMVTKDGRTLIGGELSPQQLKEALTLCIYDVQEAKSRITMAQDVLLSSE